MRLIFIGLLTLLFVTFLPVYAEGEVKLEIIYPKNGAVINASSSILLVILTRAPTLQSITRVFPLHKNGAFVYFTG